MQSANSLPPFSNFCCGYALVFFFGWNLRFLEVLFPYLFPPVPADFSQAPSSESGFVYYFPPFRCSSLKKLPLLAGLRCRGRGRNYCELARRGRSEFSPPLTLKVKSTIFRSLEHTSLSHSSRSVEEGRSFLYLLGFGFSEKYCPFFALCFLLAFRKHLCLLLWLQKSADRGRQEHRSGVSLFSRAPILA